MGSLPRPLMAKIKTLNETIWEGHATEPRIAEWLNNFSSQDSSAPNERHHALFLLSNFMYFGSRQIRELLKALYRDMYRYPIVKSIRRANHDTLDSDIIEPLFRAELNVTRFLGMGNPSESGCHLLYYFRQENALPSNLFIHSHEIFRRNSESVSQILREPTVTRYIFIDDFCGTGQQGIEYSREIVEEVKRLNPGASVEYYVLFATEYGISRIREQTKFDFVSAIYELDSSFRCFSASSRYFSPTPKGIDRSFCEAMCRLYGERLTGNVGDALGFGDSQLLIGFHHNTPDNTLPIIWFDERNHTPWTPIFRRYPKKMTW
jgi:hypothetical protein